jgi:hypothetical protein
MEKCLIFDTIIIGLFQQQLPPHGESFELVKWIGYTNRAKPTNSSKNPKIIFNTAGLINIA